MINALCTVTHVHQVPNNSAPQAISSEVTAEAAKVMRARTHTVTHTHTTTMCTLSTFYGAVV